MQTSRLIYGLVVGLLAAVSGQALSEDRSSKMTNDAIGRSPSHSEVQAPEVYYANRVMALSLAQQEDWQSAYDLLKSLTRQYPDDGDTWYVLGLASFQLAKWSEAIEAFEQTLALGTILSSVPTASAPSNDIMIKIAEAYAELGQADEAITWINLSLNARYDGRNTLASNPHFESIAHLASFQQAAGTLLPDNLSRVEAWQFDLDYLVSEIRRLHVNVYHAISEQDLEERIVSIRKQIPTLSDQEIVFELMTLVAALGNGHNFIVPAYANKGSFNQLPLQFYQFNDGLYIVDAQEGYEALIASKVIRIGNTLADEALERTKHVNARDNEMQHLWLGPYYLALPEVLQGLGIIDDATQVVLTIENSQGEQQQVSPQPQAMSFSGFPQLPALAGSSAMSNFRVGVPYWYQLVPENNSLYLQYNYVQNAESQSFAEFNQELMQQISEGNITNIILDLRHNAGGDGSTYPPLLETLVQFEAANANGKLFVLMGRNTFSAAHNLLLDINRLANPILVGEPSGSRPNALGEAGWFKLPYSGTWGLISSQYHQASKAEDHRIWIAPHVPVSVPASAYFANEDPAMNAVNAIIAD